VGGPRPEPAVGAWNSPLFGFSGCGGDFNFLDCRLGVFFSLVTPAGVNRNGCCCAFAFRSFKQGDDGQERAALKFFARLSAAGIEIHFYLKPTGPAFASASGRGQGTAINPEWRSGPGTTKAE